MIPSPNSQSLFARYMEEASGVKTIETESGFIAYSLGEDCVQIDHIYILPEKRSVSLFREFCAKIGDVARSNSMSFIDCHVDIEGPRARENLLIYLAYGFEVKNLGRRHIFLRLKIEVHHGRR